jgi:hypothetical protein
MDINDHKYIKLLEYVMDKKSSYVMRDALDYAKMTESEFLNVRDVLFINANMQAPPPNASLIYDWRLRPEAVFGYLNYKQYQHSVKSSNKAVYISVVSLIIAVLTLAATIYAIWPLTPLST